MVPNTQTNLKIVSEFKSGHAYEEVQGPGGLKRFLVFDTHTTMVNVDSKIIVKHEADAMERFSLSGDKFIEIPVETFKNSLRDMIFEMELYEFVKNK